MTYEQTLHYLYNKLPLYSSIGIRAYKADLHNTLALCKHLGDPQKKIKTIHIAGTNGKGSTSHMLAAVFGQCGYKTGLYTSPHLKEFRERIKINGEMIPHDFIIAFVEKIKTFSEEIQPSFFELTFVMALEYFVHERVDIAIIETGLGGRLDSTNVISPELSVITNIGFDHMDILGNSPGGRSGVSVVRGLSGRRPIHFPSMQDDFNENAKVYVDIKVDGNGKVTDAGIARGTTTSSSSLRNIAIQKAKELKFPPSNNDVESGTILFVFVLKS